MSHQIEQLNTEILGELVSTGNKYFVQQNYQGSGEEPNFHNGGCFLLSAFSDISEAEQCLAGIDQYGEIFLYSWDNPDDQQRLIKAANASEGYWIYRSDEQYCSISFSTDIESVDDYAGL